MLCNERIEQWDERREALVLDRIMTAGKVGEWGWMLLKR